MQERNAKKEEKFVPPLAARKKRIHRPEAARKKGEDRPFAPLPCVCARSLHFYSLHLWDYSPLYRNCVWKSVFCRFLGFHLPPLYKDSAALRIRSEISFPRLRAASRSSSATSGAFFGAFCNHSRIRHCFIPHFIWFCGFSLLACRSVLPTLRPLPHPRASSRRDAKSFSRKALYF